jgi:pimeloyl-ACP methyl ester carboxylesterase
MTLFECASLVLHFHRDTLPISGLLWNGGFLLLEFFLVFWSGDRRRQRRLWTHNANFKISKKFRNPFRKRNRRELLLPLLQNQDVSVSHEEDRLVHVSGGLISSFQDFVVSEKNVHIHCLTSNGDSGNVTIVYVHQFGSGSFTFQFLMSELVEEFDQIAFDRIGHGLTTVNPSVDESFDFHSFNYIDRLIGWEPTDGIRKRILFVSAGGDGCRVVLDYLNNYHNSASPIDIAGWVCLSPYNLDSFGLSSVLLSMTTAAVGRALILSMARSEVTTVIPKQAWPQIPDTLLESYRHAVDVEGWEDSIYFYLRSVGPDSLRNFQKIPSPVYTVIGDDDHFQDESTYGRLCERLFDRFEIVKIPGCGAAPQEEKPTEISSIIRKI